MSKLKKIREKFNLTQQELSEKSGISVRTIQRIESGTDPKGQTLKILARTLAVNEGEFIKAQKGQIQSHFSNSFNVSYNTFVSKPIVKLSLIKLKGCMTAVLSLAIYSVFLTACSDAKNNNNKKM
jgi:transcriptional regulator with XRE-family HTH domain